MSDNELIAEFMGGWNADPYTRRIGINIPHMNDQWWDIEELKYHSDWSWLMPVVEKIGQHTYDTHYELSGDHKIKVNDRAYTRTFGMIDDETGHYMVRINRMPLHTGVTLIEATYKSVIDYIKFNKEGR